MAAPGRGPEGEAKEKMGRLSWLPAWPCDIAAVWLSK